MFTVVVSYYAEQAYDSSANFAAHIKSGGHCVISTKYDKDVKPGETGGDATVTHMIATASPETLFTRVEEYANGGIVIPEELCLIYFEQAIYYIHAIPKDATVEQMTCIVNIALNMGCINRTKINNLRNMYLTERDSVDEQVQASSIKAVLEAVNILSKKVMGVELLTTINNKEEVKWPVH